MTPKPCITPQCGLKAYKGPRCAMCERTLQRLRNARPERARLYGGDWAKVSKAARRAHPWCTRCGAIEDLTLDHETGTVECRPCNSSHHRNPGEDRGPNVLN